MDFAQAELDAALAARGLRLRIRTALDKLPADSFVIEPNRIRGGDRRGLVYGMMEAAEQIRISGKLKPVTATPAKAVRGVRMAGKDAPAGDTEYWSSLFRLLVRSRFNRVTVEFEREPAAERVAKIAQSAYEHGLDFVLGLENVNYAELKSLLAACPSIRAVQVRSPSTEAEKATAEAGRWVGLELRGAVGPDGEMEIGREYDRTAVGDWGRRAYGPAK